MRDTSVLGWVGGSRDKAKKTWFSSGRSQSVSQESGFRFLCKSLFNSSTIAILFAQG